MQIHKCEYCDKAITPCSTPCLLRTEKEHVCCKCTADSSELCELPFNCVCDGAICQFKFQVDFYELKVEELKAQVIDGEARLKELNNIYRIMGFTPKGLEILIQTQGIEVPGMFIKQNSQFTWDKLKPEDIATVGIKFMNVYEDLSRQWSRFLNEKSVKITIKKSQLEATKKQMSVAQQPTKEERRKAREAKPKTDTMGRFVGIKLTPKEKIVLHHMQKLGMKFPDAVTYVTNVLMMPGECRELQVKPLS